MNTLDPKTHAYLSQVLADFKDDSKFARESLSILNKDGDVVPLTFNPAQRRLQDTILSLQSQGRPIRLVVLKSRRVGFTTGIAAKVFKDTVFVPGQHSIVVAHDIQALQNSIYPIYRMYQNLYKPFRDLIALPKLVKDTQHLMIWENGSQIEIRTAKNTEGARSSNLRRVHLSEFSIYPDARQLMTALMQCVPDDPNTMVFVEFTPKGVGGAAYDMWQRTINPKTAGEWVPIFFPWYDDETCWRAIPEDELVGFENSLTDEEHQLKLQYRLSLEQLNFRRWAITNKCEGSTELFLQEYASNDIDCFLTSGSPVFNRKYIARHATKEPAYFDLTLERVGIEKRIIATIKDPSGFKEDSLPLAVWSRPESGHQYVIGIDTAQGINRAKDELKPDRDFSVAIVLDRNTGEQVARFRDRITERAFGEIVYLLGVWYNNAYLVPEMTGGNGRAMLDVVLNLGYMMSLIYHNNTRGAVSYDDLGWVTSSVSRPKLISALDTALMEHSITLYDKVTKHELSTFVRNNDGKGEAEVGSHDDTVIALALAVIGLRTAPPIKLLTDGVTQRPVGPTRYRGGQDGDRAGSVVYENGQVFIRNQHGRRY